MAKHKIYKVEGHYLAGLEIDIDGTLVFLTTGISTINTSNGDFVHLVKAASAAAYKIQGSTSGTDIILIDATIGSELITINGSLTFATITSPEIDSTGGGFIWKIITAVTSAWKLRDNTKGQDIITIDTDTDTVTANDTDYTFVGFDSKTVVELVFADSPYTASWGEDINCDTTAGVITINLPTSVGNHGKTLNVTKNDAVANDVIYAANGAEVINTNLPLTLTSQYSSATFISINDTNIGKR